MSNLDYADAKRQLDRVVQQKVFHYQPPQEPWYQRLWLWVLNHLHLSLKLQTVGSAAGVTLVVIVLVVLAALIAWFVFYWRRRSAKLYIEERPGDTTKSLWSQVGSLMATEEWTAALHLMLTIAIRQAEDQDWLSDSPGKTARRCLKELRKSADADFASLFQQLVDTTELAMFAGEPVSGDVIHSIADSLKLWPRRVSA